MAPPASPQATHRRTLVSLDAAANYCGCSPRTIRRMIASGKIAGYRVGSRLLRVDIRELDVALRQIPTTGGAA